MSHKYCPKCRTEYENWVITCADCGAELMYELPKEDAAKPVEPKFVRVMTAYDDGEIMFLKSILDTTDIVYYFQSKSLRITRPEQAPAYLMVEDSRVEEVQKLLADFMKDDGDGSPACDEKPN